MGDLGFMMDDLWFGGNRCFGGGEATAGAQRRQPKANGTDETDVHGWGSFAACEGGRSMSVSQTTREGANREPVLWRLTANFRECSRMGDSVAIPEGLQPLAGG